MPTATIESLDHDGRGVSHVDGKAIFIEGALPGESVEYASYRRKPRYENASTVAVLHPSSQRVLPRCRHFGHCGGCSMQHLDRAGQIAAKQRVLEDALKHIGNVRSDEIFSPISAHPWGYRHRARMSVRMVPKKGGALVGFHERHSSFVAVMDSCEILPPRVSSLIRFLKTLVESLSRPDRLPQVEVAVDDVSVVLVLRHLEPLTDEDQLLLRTFADVHDVVWYLQPAGVDSVTLFYPEAQPLPRYHLQDFGVELEFSPTEFTQVNPGINRMLVRRAMTLLRPEIGERIADLFCGLGNFTLPIARAGAQVTGVEGSRALVDRANSNASRNHLADRCDFLVENLFDVDSGFMARLATFDKLLIDPPREGAVAVAKAIPLEGGPERIVYVSCNPATLARDAAILVHEKAYRLAGAGIANMFPQTSHLESIAIFER